MLEELVDTYDPDTEGPFSACHPRTGAASMKRQLENILKALKTAKVWYQYHDNWKLLHCFCLAVKLAFQRNCQTVQSLLMKKVSRYRRCSWTGLFQTGDQVWPVILCVKLVCDSFPPCVDRWVSLPADRAGFFIFLSTGKRGYQRTGNPFIKRFRHVQTVQPLYGGGCPPPGLAT